MADSLEIVRLGAAGDGIAEGADGRPIYVAGALPGDRVADGGRGAIEPSSPSRSAPACPHFGVCGGCGAQHMNTDLYAAWKRDIVVGAFRQHGLAPEIAPLISVPTHSRRRATFSVARVLGRGSGARLSVGFHKRQSDEVLELSACAVLTARLFAARTASTQIASVLGAARSEENLRIAMADLDGGVDLHITGLSAPLTPEQRAKLGMLAAKSGFARLTVGREIIVTRCVPRLVTRAGAIVPPPGAFFQAVAAAEQAIVDLVTAAVPLKAKRGADLYCGVGTLSLPLAQRLRVLAVDSDRPALDALAAATRATQGLKPIETRLRDLFREPLSVKELEDIDFAVLDPPRAGAKAQAATLAKSKVPVVAMVSCDPGTLARDCRLLVDGGYRIETVTPIDQFLWSNHVETVAILRR